VEWPAAAKRDPRIDSDKSIENAMAVLLQFARLRLPTQASLGDTSGKLKDLFYRIAVSSMNHKFDKMRQTR
jgi:hypothetical protein